MSKKSLIVLSVCLVIAAGIVAYVWASGCCGGDPGETPCICNGARFHIADTCRWHFTVDHSRECGMGHDVYVYMKGQNGDPYIGILLSLETPGPPYPICTQYAGTLELNPNTVYYYYFRCADCEEECCGDHFNTGDCGS